jgi:hypothetical protein
MNKGSETESVMKVAGSHIVTLEELIQVIRSNMDYVVGSVCKRVLQNVPEYHDVPYLDLHDSVAELISLLLVTIHSDATEVDKEKLLKWAQRRASSGVSHYMLDRAVAEGTLQFGEFMEELARLNIVTPDIRLQAVETLFRASTVIPLSVSEVFNRREIELARYDQSYRTEFLHRLFSGTLSLPDIISGTPVFGLEPNGVYMAFRARPIGAAVPGSAGLDSSTCMELVREACLATNRNILLSTFDGDVAGIVKKMPRKVEVPICMAVGKPAGLAVCYESFRQASRVLDAGTAFGYTGLLTIESLGMLLAVYSNREVGAYVMQRYIVPTRSDESFTKARSGQDILAILRSYMEHDRNVAATATAVHLHQNTLRYHIERYSQVVGVDFHDPKQTAELWWALELLRLGRAIE